MLDPSTRYGISQSNSRDEFEKVISETVGVSRSLLLLELYGFSGDV